MPKSLPARARLDHLRRQAKTLHKSCQEGRTDALARIGSHRRPRRSPAEGSRALTLQDAQLAIAREYGFTSWRALAEAVRQKEHGNELSRLILKGDLAAVRKALDTSQPVSGLTDVWGWRLLHVAALRGKLDMARLLWDLLSSGADPNAISKQGRTPLLLARECRDTETAALLKRHGAIQ